MAVELGGVIFLTTGGSLAALGWRWPFSLYLLAWLFLIALLAFVPKTQPHGHAHADARDTGPGIARLFDVYLAACGAMVVFFVAIITLPGYLARAGFSESGVGYYLACVSLVAVAAASMMPNVVRVIGARATLVVAFGLFACAHAVYAMAPGAAGLGIAARRDRNGLRVLGAAGQSRSGGAGNGGANAERRWRSCR